MAATEPFVDIHCHLVPGIDDGASSLDESLEMARMAVRDGIETIIVTPHQLGAYAHNSGDVIRQRTAKLQQTLDDERIPLEVLPGGDVRIEAEMIGGLKTGQVMTLADQGKHVLLELPHEMYFPLEPVLDSLHKLGMVGILSHPERNQGILKQRELIQPLVERGCLMQVTAGSLMGTFGPRCQEFSEWMIDQGLVHFLATDAHSPKSRRPLMARAFHRVAEMAGEQKALDVCCRNPGAVADGLEVAATVDPVRSASSRRFSWFPWRKAG